MSVETYRPNWVDSKDLLVEAAKRIVEFSFSENGWRGWDNIDKGKMIHLIADLGRAVEDNIDNA